MKELRESAIFFENNAFMQSQIISRSNFFHYHGYFLKVKVQVQYGHGLLRELVPRISDIGLAC